MQFSAATVVLAVLVLAGQALAQTPAVDGPVSTAPAGGGSPLSTQQQIDQYLAPSPDDNRPRAGVAATDLDADRRIHGEVSVAVGSNGYRGGSVSAVIPIGEAATLALSYSKSKGGYGYVDNDRPGYVYDSLSAPSAIGAACGANSRGPEGRGLTVVTGSSPAPAEHCAAR